MCRLPLGESLGWHHELASSEYDQSYGAYYSHSDVSVGVGISDCRGVQFNVNVS